MGLPLLSLFCGAGGLDDGFRRAGFTTVLAVDNCEDAVRTFNHNAEPQAAIVRDLAELTPVEFLKLVPSGCAPVGLIGGPPCQGFSRANVLADANDPRNKLPFRYAALLKAANKKYNLHFFVFENVAGLLGQKHSSRLKQILSKLHDAGFKVFTGSLDARDFGVPQRRRRLFIVGLNKRLYPDVQFTLPRGTGGDERTIASAIRGLPAPVFFSRDLKAETIPHHPNHWTMRPKSRKFASNSTGDGRSFKRLKWDEVSATVAYGNREIHVHPDGERRLSVYEAMLLQGFPPDYELTGTLSAQVTQVSNAVPPPVAEAIALSIKTLITSKTDVCQFRSPNKSTAFKSDPRRAR
jgi:DNA (cytosine-5)-methyltransferase 1